MPRGRVLVVDDDPILAAAICEFLREGDWQGVSARSDQLGYRKIDASRDLRALVLDVNLGEGTTGYDLGRYARRRFPRVAVVFTSGDTTLGAHKTFGVDGSVFLGKPFSAEQLLEAIDAQSSPPSG